MRQFFGMNKKISILVSFLYKYLPLYVVMFIYTHVARGTRKTNEQRSNVRTYVTNRRGFSEVA
jgi:hypothetical protein